MIKEITLRLTNEDAGELAYLSAAVGFPPEAAALYAVRLVSACVKEGLFADMPTCAWPPQARIPGLFGEETSGKILSFERTVKEEEAHV